MTNSSVLVPTCVCPVPHDNQECSTPDGSGSGGFVAWLTSSPAHAAVVAGSTVALLLVVGVMVVRRNRSTTISLRQGHPQSLSEAGMLLAVVFLDRWVCVSSTCLKRSIPCCYCAPTLRCAPPPPHRRHQADSLREAFIGVDMTYVINAAEIECDYHRPIGSGGFAQVFRGVYKGMDVAVKVIHSSLMQSMDR